jgi:hypothetical protein
MTIDTARLRALAEAAAPGPWSVHGNGKDEWYVYALDARYGPQSVYGESPVKVAWVPCAPFGGRNARDCAYIAAASPDAILALLAERDALVRERDSARQQCLDGTREVLRMKVAAEAERDALAALLQRARTALADMDRACDRDLIDAIDALDGAKGNER